jgi:Outer membrane protein beta-barrel domain
MAKHPSRTLSLVVLAAATLLVGPALGAQGSGDGFLFRKPVGAFIVRGGFASPMARGDLYSFFENQFTLNKGDFRSPSLGAELLVGIAPRLDLDFGVGVSGSKTASEFRHFVGTDDLPIQQTTSLTRVPLTAGARIYLAPKGRSIGSFVWIPNKIVPYVGAGGGMMWYRLHQAGEFIDFQTTDVFDDAFESSGWAPAAHGMAGVDYTITPRLALTGEARYTWAKTKLGSDFTGFDGIDLSEFGVTLGLNVRF